MVRLPETSNENSFKLSLGYLKSGGSTAPIEAASPTPASSLLGTRFQTAAAPVTDFFGNIGNRARGFVPLTGGSVQEIDETGVLGSLTWTQRMLGFIICSAAGAACFVLSMFTLPFLPISPHKFAVTFTFGSILIMIAFALLRGPMAHLRHLFSRERLPFTVTYFASMLLTLLSSLVYRNYFGTIVSAIIQAAAITWYFVSYLPGGSAGLRMGTRALSRGILPI